MRILDAFGKRASEGPIFRVSDTSQAVLEIWILYIVQQKTDSATAAAEACRNAKRNVRGETIRGRLEAAK